MTDINAFTWTILAIGITVYGFICYAIGFNAGRDQIIREWSDQP